MPDQPTFGEFILGLEGLAILRSWMTNPKTVKARSKEIANLVSRLDEAPWSKIVVGVERTVAAGYAESAATYDEGQNPLVLAEKPIVQKLIASHPAGEALDAACGTGRHAKYLASQGHRVTGIDASPVMLELARSKVPDAHFQVADLTSIPLPSESVDIAVCSLALTHCSPLGPAVTELSRVLRPGGTAIISDLHPFLVMLGSHSEFPRSGNEKGFVRNHIHLASDYIAAFKEAKLDIIQCIEQTYGDLEIAAMGFAKQINDVQMDDLMEAAVKGIPIVIVWELTKSD